MIIFFRACLGMCYCLTMYSRMDIVCMVIIAVGLMAKLYVMIAPSFTG